MRRDNWCLLAACPVLLAVGSAGCYQTAAPPGATGVAPVSQSMPVSADEESLAVPVTAVASSKVPDGMECIVLSVPGMH